MSETLVVDGDAYDPIPVGRVRIGGREYGFLSVFDVDQLTLMKLKRLEQHLSAIPSLDEQTAFVRDLICTLVPGLSQEALANDPVNKLLWRLRKITSPANEDGDDPLGSKPTG